MISVVLAAGRGTRLAGLDVPKPLAPVGGVPVIDRILDTLAADGLADAVIVTGHRAGEVERHLADRTVRVVRQHAPLGTADALLVARSEVGDEPFLVTWADVIVEPGTYRRIVDARPGHDGAVAVDHRDDLSAGGAVTVGEGLVQHITEKPGPGAGWNHAGVSAYGPGIWEHLMETEPSVRGEYELPDALNAWIGEGARLAAVPVENVFEIGTPAGLAAADAYWSGETRPR